MLDITLVILARSPDLLVSPMISDAAFTEKEANVHNNLETDPITNPKTGPEKNFPIASNTDANSLFLLIIVSTTEFIEPSVFSIIGLTVNSPITTPSSLKFSAETLIKDARVLFRSSFFLAAAPAAF